jgi:hypothetical protein
MAGPAQEHAERSTKTDCEIPEVHDRSRCKKQDDNVHIVRCCASFTWSLVSPAQDPSASLHPKRPASQCEPVRDQHLQI